MKESNKQFETPFHIHPTPDGWVFSLQEQRRIAPITKNIKQEEKFKILLTRESFTKGIEKLRKAFQIPNNGFNNEETDDVLRWAKKLYGNTNKKQEFFYKYKQLFITVGISSRWREIIDYFLLYNVNASNFLLPPPLEIMWDSQGERLRLTIELFKDTTLDDLKKFYKEEFKKYKLYLGEINHTLAEKIRTNLKDLYIPRNNSVSVVKQKQAKRTSKHPNLEKSTKIRRLFKEGQTYPEVAKSVEESNNFTRMAILKYRLNKLEEQDYLD